MWCRKCMHETEEETCELCKEPTQEEVSVGVYWCAHCLTPVILEKTAENTVWASDRYYVDGKSHAIHSATFDRLDVSEITTALDVHKLKNDATLFEKIIARFVSVNRARLNLLSNEAIQFLRESSKNYQNEQVVISFSGGKDSTVTADLVTRGLRKHDALACEV